MPSKISANEARVIVERLFSGKQRNSILKCIARSVQVAHQLAPLKWGLRINATSVMLKVGFVETLTFRDGWFRWLAARDSIPRRLKLDVHSEIGLAPYKRAPRCDSVNFDNHGRAIKIYNSLFAAHVAALEIASRSQRRQDTLRDHAPRLIEYISQELGVRLPQPSWLQVGSSLAEEIDADDARYEGAATRILVNRYERDFKVRELCIEKFGYRCAICEMTMSDRYGTAAAGVIHVHHLKPISEYKQRRKVDPKKDLRPVCPNCHTVVHLRSPPYSILEVKKMLRVISS